MKFASTIRSLFLGVAFAIAAVTACAKVVQTDIVASNGVIHVIDTVVLPQ